MQNVHHMVVLWIKNQGQDCPLKSLTGLQFAVLLRSMFCHWCFFSKGSNILIEYFCSDLVHNFLFPRTVSMLTIHSFFISYHSTGVSYNQWRADPFLGFHVPGAGRFRLRCTSLPPALRSGLWNSYSAVVDYVSTAPLGEHQAHLHPHACGTGWHPSLLQLFPCQAGYGLPASGEAAGGHRKNCGQLPTSEKRKLMFYWSCTIRTRSILVSVNGKKN